MEIEQKKQRLKKFLQQIAIDGHAESLAEPVDDFGLESTGSGDQMLESANAGILKISRAQEDDLSDDEMNGLEAIILPKHRPVVDIINGSFHTPPSPWSHLGSGDPKKSIESAIPSVGRIELPNHDSIPYGGTGFVVGEDLLMTNRHVAELFANGLGELAVDFRPGQTSAIDFQREIIPADPIMVEIKKIVMIHPWWDMALLKVDGLDKKQKPLTLSVAHPDDLVEQDVAVIGYPAQDMRNEIDLQNRIFRGVYNVKRMQPGKIKTIERRKSYGNQVAAVTHDSSTLGGNSGSAIVETKSGNVVGLHFAGKYLEANFAVATHELARDPRVVAAGLNFRGTVPPTDEWDDAWNRADGITETSVSVTKQIGKASADNSIANADTSTVDTQTVTTQTSSAQSSEFEVSISETWNIPVRVTVSVGKPSKAQKTDAVSDSADAEFALKPDPDYANRKGYDPEFLGPETVVPLPTLSPTLMKNVAYNKLATEDRHVLPYQNFSLVMNKERRLAFFTAVNIDGSREEDISRKEFSDRWFLDPRIDDAYQLQNDLYRKNNFDRGHLVRRLDPVWGEPLDARKAHDDTFHWTNCSPQHKNFNRNRTTWGLVENWILEKARAANQKVTVFTGPIFQKTDGIFKTEAGDEVQIPNRFWKIVVLVKEDGQLSATAYLLTQQELIADMLEAVPEEPKSFQTTVKQVERFTKLSFGELANHDTYARRNEAEGLESMDMLETPIKSFEDLVL